MDNKDIKERLITAYTKACNKDGITPKLAPESPEDLLEPGTTKVYVVSDILETMPGASKADAMIKAFVELCQAAKIFANVNETNAQFIGDGTNRFDYLKVPFRGVVVCITVLPSPVELGGIAVASKQGYSFALVHIDVDHAEIQSSGSEFVSQTTNLLTGQFHTCVYSIGTMNEGDVFPSYMPLLVCPTGYNDAQEAIDNQEEDLKNTVNVSEFKRS